MGAAATMERRLSAILAADVVGYSRLMGVNEVGTLTNLKSHRTELIDPTIAEHQGRIVKQTGDGMLVEFTSVVNAVECAAEIQRDMRARNTNIPEDRRIEFRIGINLGDVIAEDDDIFGDGVNVAARLESVAIPGGIAISSSVRENVGNRLDLVFEDMGEQQLKNIEFPTRVYNVVLGDAPSRSRANGAKHEASDVEKPSIAVLPFINMSGDPEQEYFSDGITEDIITDLSKVSGLFVVGRNTSFLYKGKTVQLQEAAAELGVKFLLEGSVRKAGDRVRVNGQLIDGTSGGHLWADRFDRDLTDIFAIQDEITQSIVDQLKVRLLPKEKKAISQAPTASVEAYNLYLKARQLFHIVRNKKAIIQARQLFAKAIELDPKYALAFAGIANCDARLAGWYNDPIASWEILAIADRALSIDPNLADAHAAKAVALSFSGRTDEAAAAFEKALAIDPNSVDANLSYARFCMSRGDNERALELLLRSLELQPEDPQPAFYLYMVCRALGRSDDAERYARLGVKRAEEAMKSQPENSRPAQGAACALAAIGEKEEAKRWLERALELDPDDNNALYNAACAYALIGEPDQAFDILERWSRNIGSEQVLWFKTDTDLDPLRNHPRYRKLAEMVGAQD